MLTTTTAQPLLQQRVAPGLGSSTSSNPLLSCSTNSDDLINIIPIKGLAELTSTTSFLLRNHVNRLFLDIAIQDPHFSFILYAIKHFTADSDDSRKAITVIQHLSKLHNYQSILLHNKVPELAANLLIHSNDPFTLKEALIVLYELCSTKDSLRIHLVDHHRLLDGLHRTIKMSQHTDLHTWTLFLLHNLATCEPVQSTIANSWFFPDLGASLRITYGNWTLQKLCFHTLVRLIGWLDTGPVSQRALFSLAPFNLIGLLSSALRVDDGELIYWALGLAHECSIKDVFRNEMRTTEQFLRVTMKLIDWKTDLGATKLALRVLKFIGLRTSEFHKALVETYKIVGKIMNCLSVNEDPNIDDLNQATKYWALTLLHDLASVPSATLEILDHASFGELVQLIQSRRFVVPLYVVDIISYICTSSCLTYQQVLDHPQLRVCVVDLLLHPDSDVVGGGLACIHNLATLSPLLILSSMRLLGLDKALASAMLEPIPTISSLLSSPLLDKPSLAVSVASTRARIDAMAAKVGILMTIAPVEHPLSSLDQDELPDPAITYVMDAQEIREWVVDHIVQPYILGIVIEASHLLVATVSSVLQESTPKSPSSSSPLTDNNKLDCGQDQLRLPESNSSSSLLPDTTNVPATSDGSPAGNDFKSAALLLSHILAERTGGALQAMLIFASTPSLMHDLMDRHLDIIEILVDALYDLVMFPLVGAGMVLLPEKPWHVAPADITEKDLQDLNKDCLQTKLTVATSAIHTLATMYSYGPIQSYLTDERFTSTMIACMRMYPKKMTVPVLCALASCIESMDRVDLLSTPWIVDLAWYAALCGKSLTDDVVYSKHVIRLVTGLILDLSFNINPEIETHTFVRLNANDRSSGILVGVHGQEVWNPGRAFESIRATHGVSYAGKWMYEVELVTNDLLQLGWATNQSKYDVACGRGIGDDNYSFAYDGDRQRAWHGLVAHTEGIPYGQKWNAGDVIGCCIDLDSAQLEFFSNGESLGIVFYDINVDDVWFPAISLSSNQGCTVRFGSVHDPVRYYCDSYVPIGSSTQMNENNYLHLSAQVPSPRPVLRTTTTNTPERSPLTPGTASPLHHVKEILFETLPMSIDVHVPGASTTDTGDVTPIEQSQYVDIIDLNHLLQYIEVQILDTGARDGDAQRFDLGVQNLDLVTSLFLSVDLRSQSMGIYRRNEIYHCHDQVLDKSALLQLVSCAQEIRYGDIMGVGITVGDQDLQMVCLFTVNGVIEARMTLEAWTPRQSVVLYYGHDVPILARVIVIGADEDQDCYAFSFANEDQSRFDLVKYRTVRLM